MGRGEERGVGPAAEEVDLFFGLCCVTHLKSLRGRTKPF